MADEKQPLGTLFGRIAYYKSSDVNNIIDSMDFPQGYYMITQALEYANSSGLFSIQEAEIISKSLRLINNDNK